MDNPRFPHTLQVLRARRVNGELQFDAEGNPAYDVLVLQRVEMLDNVPIKDECGQFVTTPVDSIEFGYRTDTMNTKVMGDVISLNYKLSCPMFVTELKYDDILAITDYDRTYHAEVVKQATHNWGTNIWFNEIQN